MIGLGGGDGGTAGGWGEGEGALTYVVKARPA